MHGDELGEGTIGIALGKGIGTVRCRRTHHIGGARDVGGPKVEVHQSLGHDGMVGGDLRRDRTGHRTGSRHAGARVGIGIVDIELGKAQGGYGHRDRLGIAIGVLQLDVGCRRRAAKVG